MAKKLLFRGLNHKYQFFWNNFFEAPFTKAFWTYLESAKNKVFFYTHKSIFEEKKNLHFFEPSYETNFFLLMKKQNFFKTQG